MEILKKKTVAFTGNRTLTSPDGCSGKELLHRIENELFTLIEEHFLAGRDTFISGMAVGFDMLAACTVLKLQEKYPTIKLVVAIPFRGQEQRYSEVDKALYHSLLERCTMQVVVCDFASIQAYHQRNDFMIDSASFMVAYHDGRARSGTGSTLRKAALQGVKVVNLYSI